MKTSLTKLKNSLILLLTFLVLPLWAKPVAQVTSISGQAFMVGPDGRTVSLKLHDHLEERAEVMVEEGGSITLNDYFDATYHLTGGSHLKFYNRSVQLKQGKAWIQSYNARHPLALTTANGHVDFWKGEFITTFDQTTARSQVLVVSGDVDVSNVLDRNMKYTVHAGSFTIVDPEVENGVPRAPTKVGLASLNSALAEFKKLPSDIRSAPVLSRSIASVEEVPVKKGKIIYIKSGRLPASVGSTRQTPKKKAPKRAKLTHAPIKFYGVEESKSANLDAHRKPASIRPLTVVPEKAAETLNIDPEFAESLKRESEQQPKYSKELESLIKDLKSF